MNSRERFIRDELERIYNILNSSFETVPYSRLEQDKRCLRLFELLFEISKRAVLLQQIIKQRRKRLLQKIEKFFIEIILINILELL